MCKDFIVKVNSSVGVKVRVRVRVWVKARVKPDHNPNPKFCSRYIAVSQIYHKSNSNP